MHISQAVKMKGTKLGKALVKSIKEAKEGKATVVYDGKWHVGEKEFDNPKDYIAYIRKQEKEKLNRMSPKKRKELKEKEKKNGLSNEQKEVIQMIGAGALTTLC